MFMKAHFLDPESATTLSKIDWKPSRVRECGVYSSLCPLFFLFIEVAKAALPGYDDVYYKSAIRV